ncbi:GGDEF domain-containing protein [Sphingomonas endophytica]|uniref:diguanylate cyclase n=1 Tax=Sphingomonas endophytica TaxID=869719 RepID=A0A147I0Z2_9SPHN|nr:GGDEF domain-containing protein [Sphingomonas endophytica]KTT71097.1 hypothetical protein NS334_11025 [Sphingomonas endophytica]
MTAGQGRQGGVTGALYALIVNVCIALLFAASFAVVRASYPQQRASIVFCMTYAWGTLTPLSELAVHYTPQTLFFVALSYGSFTVSMLCFLAGVALIAERPLPAWLIPTLAAAALVGRVGIWNVSRDTLLFGVVFQAPYYIIFVINTAIAARAARTSRDPMWLLLGIIFAASACYFMAKPFFAAAFGFGDDPRAYATSGYALFSQAVGGLLMVMSGLAVLLMIIRLALRSSQEASETDTLTNVANRRGFERQAAAMLAQAERDGKPLAAIMFDLDHFKRVNDSFGHATGDGVLRAVAQAAQRALPDTALIARLGGEEFCALLDRTTLRGAALVGQAIRDAVAEIDPHLPRVTISGGIAQLRPTDTLVTLLDRADRRAYEAKANGRDRIYPLLSLDRSAEPEEGPLLL